MRGSKRRVAIAATLLLLRRRQRRRRQREHMARNRKPRRFWVRPWLLRRELYGQYDTLMQELAAEDIDGYISFQRICPELFQELLSMVGPAIEKKDTTWRPAIPVTVRLALTLRFLATGK